MRARRFSFIIFILVCFLSAASLSLAVQQSQVIKITAKKFVFNPDVIKLKKGVPAVLELTSLDRRHGFNCPELGIRSDINPGQTSRVSFTPQKKGTFTFFCDVFCGDGHGDMSGKIIVEE